MNTSIYISNRFWFPKSIPNRTEIDQRGQLKTRPNKCPKQNHAGVRECVRDWGEGGPIISQYSLQISSMVKWDTPIRATRAHCRIIIHMFM